MKKSVILMSLIMIVLLVNGAGCEKKGKGREGTFIGGNLGLDVAFVEDAPSISGNFQKEAFPVEIVLINKGETEVGKGSAKVYLTGALYSSASITTSKKEGSNDDFIAAIEESEEGVAEDSIVVSMEDVTYTGEILGDSVPLDVSAKVCYPYETKVQINDFCIPTTIRKITSAGECQIDSSKSIIKEGDNSGAPVKITSLREDEGSNYVRITLDINNVGTGEVVNLCKRELSREEINKVMVEMPSNFECGFKDRETNKGEVDLRSGHAVLRCKRSVTNSGSAYKEPIAIRLNYYYMQEVTKTVTINKA